MYDKLLRKLDSELKIVVPKISRVSLFIAPFSVQIRLKQNQIYKILA